MILTNINNIIMKFGVLIIVFLNISNHPSHLEQSIHSIQIVVRKSFVVISNVSIKAVDCIVHGFCPQC